MATAQPGEQRAIRGELASGREMTLQEAVAYALAEWDRESQV